MSTSRSSEETALVRAILAALTKLGYWAIRINSGTVRGPMGFIQLAPPGTPDILVLAPYMWLEVKDLEKLSESQHKWHERALRAQIPVETVRSVEQACKAVYQRDCAEKSGNANEMFPALHASRCDNSQRDQLTSSGDSATISGSNDRETETPSRDRIRPFA